MEDEKVFTPRDLDLIRRMIGKEEIPQAIQKVYLRHKKLLDRIDGRFSISHLASIALEAGFNPETGKFTGEKIPIEVSADEQPENAEPVKEAEEGETAPPEEAETKEPEPEAPKEPETISPGTEVEFFEDGQVMSGKIVGASGQEGALQYRIDTDDGSYSVAAEDVMEV